MIQHGVYICASDSENVLHINFDDKHLNGTRDSKMKKIRVVLNALYY